MGQVALVLRNSKGQFTSKGFAIGVMGLWALGAIGSTVLAKVTETVISAAERKLAETKAKKSEKSDIAA